MRADARGATGAPPLPQSQMPHPTSSLVRTRRPAAIATLVFLAALSAGQDRGALGEEGWTERPGDVAAWPDGPGAGELDGSAAPLEAGFVAVPASDAPPADAPPADGGVALVTDAAALPPAVDGPEGYPHPVEFLTVTVDGGPAPLAFMDVSPTGPVNGRTALLLHDRGEAGDRWTATIVALAADGYRVLVPDQIGHGLSGRPGLAPDAAALAAHALVLLDSLGAPRVAVVGEGLGAEVAVRLAADAAGVVERLAIVAPAEPAGAEAPALHDPVRDRTMPVLVTAAGDDLPARLGRFLDD